MPPPLVRALLLTFLAIVGVNWPPLPLNASVADGVFVLLAIAVISMPLPKLAWRRSDTAGVLYLAGAVPAILISTDHRASLIEFARELYVAVIYVVIAVATSRGFAKTIGAGMAIGGAILSAAGLLFVVMRAAIGITWTPIGEVMQLPYLGDTLRLRGLTFTPAMLACVLTATVPFAIVMCAPRARRWCLAASSMCGAVLLTFSHAIAGFAVAALLATWPSLGEWPRLRRAAVAGVIVVVLGFNFAATAAVRSVTSGTSGYADTSQYFYGVDQRELRIGGWTVNYNVMSYARIKQVAWRAWLEHPVAGVGLDRFHTQTERAFQEGRLTEMYREIDPHSALPGRLAECGLIGGLTLLFLWVCWAQLAIDSARRSALGLAAAAAFAGLLVCSVNADIMNFRFLWVVAGLMRGLQESTDPNASTPLNDQGHAPR